MPAKAGIQNYLKTLDSRLRGNDAKGRFKTFLRFHQNWDFEFCSLGFICYLVLVIWYLQFKFS